MLADPGWLHIARLLTCAARYPIPSHDREELVLLRSNSARRIGKKHGFAQHIAISGPYRVEYGVPGIGQSVAPRAETHDRMRLTIRLTSF